MPPRDRLLFCGALMLMPLIHLGLRFFGLGRISFAIARVVPVSTDKSPERTESDALACALSAGALVNKAANKSLFRANYLDRSVTLGLLLRLQQIVTDLRIGVRKNANQPEAHALIEYNTIVINDRDDIRLRSGAPFCR